MLDREFKCRNELNQSMPKTDILSDPKSRDKSVKKFAKELKSLKVDYLVAAQPRDISLAGMIFAESSLPMSYLHDDGTLTGQAELWKSKSPALIIDSVDDFALISKTVASVKAGGGRMKYGFLNGKPSVQDLGKLKGLGLTWRVVT